MRAKSDEDLFGQRAFGIDVSVDQALPHTLVEAGQRQTGTVAVQAVECAEVVANEPGVRAGGGADGCAWRFRLLFDQRGRVKTAGHDGDWTGASCKRIMDTGAH